MFCIQRFSISALYGITLLLFDAAPSSAQIHGGMVRPGYGMGYPRYGSGFSTRGFAPIPPQYFGGLPPLTPVRPLPAINRFNPLMFNPLSPNYSPQLSNTVLYYGFNRLYSQSSYSPYSFPSYGTGYSSIYPKQPTYGGYMSGYLSGSAMQRDYGRAQYQAGEASNHNARNAIADQAAYERRAVPKPEAKLAEDDHRLARALAGVDAADVASGAALNQILAATIPVDKGEKVNSSFLPPNLLAEIRFTGGATADALNVIRTSGHLAFPNSFENGRLGELKPRIEKDFAAAAGPILIGKPGDPAKMAALEVTTQQMHTAVSATIKELDFEEATATRRFVNQLDSTVSVLKKPELAAVVNPKWTTEGASVADLVRHMAKFKLQFGAVRKGGEDSYIGLHRGLADFMFALLEKNAPTKKP